MNKNEWKSPDRQRADLQEKCTRKKKGERRCKIWAGTPCPLLRLCHEYKTVFVWVSSTAVKNSWNKTLMSQSRVRPCTDRTCRYAQKGTLQLIIVVITMQFAHKQTCNLLIWCQRQQSTSFVKKWTYGCVTFLSNLRLNLLSSQPNKVISVRGVCLTFGLKLQPSTFHLWW